MRKICAVCAMCLLLLLGLTACGDEEGASSLGTLAESALSQLEEAESELEVMTVEETIDQFKTLPPQMLGLEGESLSEYDILYKHASVPVDGVPCLQITVYGTNEAGMNDPMETYLYARDGTALYQLDVSTDTITKLDMGGEN